MHRCEDLIDAIGINVHLGHGGSPYVARFSECAAALDDLGVRHLRDDIVLVGTEPAGQFERIATLARRGYRFSLVFYDGLTPWSSRATERFARLPTGPRTARHRGGRQRAAGGGAAGPCRLSADHQAALFRAVRDTPRHRAVQVAGPSYIQANIAAAENLSASVDLANVHAYPGLEHPETRGAGSLAGFLAAVRPVFGSAPVLVTETGYHTRPGHPERPPSGLGSRPRPLPAAPPPVELPAGRATDLSVRADLVLRWGRCRSGEPVRPDRA